MIFTDEQRSGRPKKAPRRRVGGMMAQQSTLHRKPASLNDPLGLPKVDLSTAPLTACAPVSTCTARADTTLLDRPSAAENITAILQRAEHELYSFYHAVLSEYGETEARMAAEDWLEPIEGIQARPDDTVRYWRRLTIAAASRLATRFCNPC
jgi:hypothetical protein